jgi:trichothecene 3-O-acetyltransferase
MTYPIDLEVDILAQQPTLNVYTQICLCYPLSGSFSANQSVIDTLKVGLERLTANFPWVAGQIVNEGANEGNSGKFKIRPLEKFPQLIVKDLTKDSAMPSFATMSKAQFPFHMLNENVVAPRNTLPKTFEGDVLPVFVVQANFIDGGLLLTFVTHHKACDMVGQGSLMFLLSKACYNEPFSDEEILVGNLERANLIPSLDERYQPGSELDFHIVKQSQLPSSSEQDDVVVQTPKCCWDYFLFSAPSLTRLKVLAESNITHPVRYVSTDDALTAFIWQSIARARKPRLDPVTVTKLGRAVDVRRYLSVPDIYPGLLQSMSYHPGYSIQQLIERPLGAIASELRLLVDPKTSNLGWRTRALATFARSLQDKNGFSFAAAIDTTADLMISSWSKVDLYGLDFNLGLGNPVSVRRPQFEPVESLIYFLPKKQDGEVAVAISLREEDMKRLKKDTEFLSYSTKI